MTKGEEFSEEFLAARLRIVLHGLQAAADEVTDVLEMIKREKGDERDARAPSRK